MMPSNTASLFPGTMAGDIVFGSIDRELFRIKPDGAVILADGVGIDDAAAGFWNAVNLFRRTKEAAVCDLLAAWKELADHVRTGVPVVPSRYPDAAVRDVAQFIRDHQDAPVAGEAVRRRISEIENLIAANKASAAWVFTQMRQLIAAPPAPAAVPVGHVSVIQQDANNYCLILRLLGMEDEGDPVAEVRQLVEARDSQPAAPQGVDLTQFRPLVEKERRSLVREVEHYDALGPATALAQVQDKIRDCDAMLAMIDSQHKQQEIGA